MPRYLAVTLAACAVVFTLSLGYVAVAAARAIRWEPLGDGVQLYLDTWRGQVCVIDREGCVTIDLRTAAAELTKPILPPLPWSLPDTAKADTGVRR